MAKTKTPKKKIPTKKAAQPKAPKSIDVRIEMIDIDKLQLNKKNPRTIKRKDLDRLKEQIKKYPKMMWIRPIVYDKGGVILGGNQRYRCLKELGWTKVPAINASKLTEQEKKNFILWDNESPGTWDMKELEQWKDLFNINVSINKPEQFNDTNAEMPIVPKFDEKYRAVLIVVETEMDFANLCTTLGMGKAKDYKSSNIKQTQVISYNDFMAKIEKWKKSK